VAAIAQRLPVRLAPEEFGIALVARILRIEGDPNISNWYQVERIYCSLKTCPACPHSDYRFRYQRNRRKRTLKKTFIAKMAFDDETLENIKKNVKSPIAIYEIKLSQKANNSVK
jgi:hypothetical protein